MDNQRNGLIGFVAHLAVKKDLALLLVHNASDEDLDSLSSQLAQQMNANNQEYAMAMPFHRYNHLTTSLAARCVVVFQPLLSDTERARDEYTGYLDVKAGELTIDETTYSSHQQS